MSDYPAPLTGTLKELTGIPLPFSLSGHSSFILLFYFRHDSLYNYSPNYQTIQSMFHVGTPTAAKHFGWSKLRGTRTATWEDHWKFSSLLVWNPCIAIFKTKQTNALPLDYHPIALTSCLCKLLKRMVNIRLMWYLEHHNHFVLN